MTDYYLLARKIISKYATDYQKSVAARDDMVISKVVDALIEADKTYDPNRLSSPKSWRLGAAIFALMNNTKMKKYKFHPLSTLSVVHKEALCDKAIETHNETVESKDNVELVSVLLSKTPLTVTQKKYLRHYYFEGKNTREIGNLYGRSKQSVQQVLQVAVVKMRKAANKSGLQWEQ